jgi:hypothetical protein
MKTKSLSKRDAIFPNEDAKTGVLNRRRIYTLSQTVRVHVKHDQICTSIVSTFLMYVQRNYEEKQKRAAVDIMVSQSDSTNFANISSLQQQPLSLFSTNTHKQVSVKNQVF